MKFNKFTLTKIGSIAISNCLSFFRRLKILNVKVLPIRYLLSKKVSFKQKKQTSSGSSKNRRLPSKPNVNRFTTLLIFTLASRPLNRDNPKLANPMHTLLSHSFSEVDNRSN